MSKAPAPVAPVAPATSQGNDLGSLNKDSFRQQPDDLDVTRNNEATNEFQSRTIELRNQRPQWITYYQLVL